MEAGATVNSRSNKATNQNPLGSCKHVTPDMLLGYIHPSEDSNGLFKLLSNSSQEERVEGEQRFHGELTKQLNIVAQMCLR